VFLRLNGVTARPDDDPLYDLTIEVASGQERDVEAIAARIAALFGLPD
jgi:prophage maintenance system killer protein